MPGHKFQQQLGFSLPILPVAQKLQVRLQPTCDETQAVALLSLTGMRTDSILRPS
jgi:hypothetical protein